MGIVEGTPILDLKYDEDSNAEVDMNVVMTGNGKFVEVQGTAEKGVFDRGSARRTDRSGENGIRELLEHQEKALAG